MLPMISAGIFGYPKKEAFQVAIRACRDFIEKESNYEMEIVFAVLEDEIMQTGLQILQTCKG